MGSTALQTESPISVGALSIGILHQPTKDITEGSWRHEYIQGREAGGKWSIARDRQKPSARDGNSLDRPLRLKEDDPIELR